MSDHDDEAPRMSCSTCGAPYNDKTHAFHAETLDGQLYRFCTDCAAAGLHEQVTTR